MRTVRGVHGSPTILEEDGSSPIKRVNLAKDNCRNAELPWMDSICHLDPVGE